MIFLAEISFQQIVFLLLNFFEFFLLAQVFFFAKKKKCGQWRVSRLLLARLLQGGLPAFVLAALQRCTRTALKQ